MVKKSRFDALTKLYPLEVLQESRRQFLEQVRILENGGSLMVGSEPQFEVSGPDALAHARTAVERLEAEIAKRQDGEVRH